MPATRSVAAVRPEIYARAELRLLYATGPGSGDLVPQAGMNDAAPST